MILQTPAPSVDISTARRDGSVTRDVHICFGCCEAVSVSTELFTNLPKMEEEEEKVLHLSTGTGLPCSTPSASLMSMDQWLPVLQLPAISPLELSAVTPSQSPVYPSPAPVDEFDSLFYMLDPKENEAPVSDVVDISEEIFLHWITC